MILLFTDFGSNGPYVGQVTARIRSAEYFGDIISVFSDAPAFSVKSCSVLLAAYRSDFPAKSVFLCVVDPGVGSQRKPLAIRTLGQWFVGPDNGLFEGILRENAEAEAYEIIWQPKIMSASFHGRDLFAPIAADLARGQGMAKLQRIEVSDLVHPSWPDVISEIVYIDHYGNAMTGLKASPKVRSVTIGTETLLVSRTFSSVEIGAPLAYENANGLIEIAVNQGRADTYFNLSIGTPVVFQ